MGVFVQLILPLKLSWEPWYSCGTEVRVGQRVRARLAGRSYLGVVSRVVATPPSGISRILPIDAVDDVLEPILESEISFWRFIAEYYMCSVGEVFRTAYPSAYVEAERKQPKSLKKEPIASTRHLREGEKPVARAVLEAFGQRSPVLLEGEDCRALEDEMARRCIEQGRDVLVVRPDCPKVSFPHLRELAKSVRGAGPVRIDCGKAGIFLPHTKLGLVIVEQEDSLMHKRGGALAPLFNARDAAAALAQQHGADLLLVSVAPSLESRYNISTGKYAHVTMPVSEARGAQWELVSTEDEFRKNGMEGRFSRRLLLRMKEAFDAKKRVLLLLPWKDTREVEIEARSHFPEARTRLVVKPLLDCLASPSEFKKFALVALLTVDFMLSRQDFRADEKAFRLLSALRASVGETPLLVQSRDCSHPVFGGGPSFLLSLFEERRRFGLPPFTRMVELSVSDDNEARARKLGEELAANLGGMQFFFAKNKNLAASKRELMKKIVIFEKEHKYEGHIRINVDPA